jgi:hypothetical protein
MDRASPFLRLTLRSSACPHSRPASRGTTDDGLAVLQGMLLKPTEQSCRSSTNVNLLAQIWNRLFGFGEFKICLVGLDNAGKTTVLFQLYVRSTRFPW